MMRILILLLSVVVWAGTAMAHNNPITILPDGSSAPFMVAPYANSPIEHFSSKTSLEGAMTAEDKTKLEQILGEELSRLQESEDYAAMIDSLEDDVSNGSIGQPLAEELEAIGRARSVIDDLKKTGNFLLKLTGGDLVNFPVGINKTIGNVSYTMGIGSMRLRPTHAELEIYVEIDIPGKDPLMFGSPNIKFTKNGGLVGDVCLSLLADYAIDIVKHKSVLKLNSGVYDEDQGVCTGGTFVTIDCDGFQQLSIDADVIFSRDWLKPVNGSDIERVEGHFELMVSSWEDILFTIDMDDFVLNRLEDVKFRVDSMVFDFSDTQMASEVNFPLGYSHPLMNTPMWQGFYVQQFQVELPERLTGGTPKVIDAENIIIDNTGFSGRIGVYPDIIPLEDGTLDGWAFSLDTFRLEMMQNQFQEVSFTGKINVPIFSTGDSEDIEETDCFGYEALINPGNVYSFTISNEGFFDVNMWQATAVIEPNSTIELLYDNNEFTATATLYGEVSVNGDPENNGFTLNVPPIPFDGLTISNKPDYFSPGVWGFPSTAGANFGAFEVVLSDISLNDSIPEEVALDFNLLVNLTGNSMAITAAGGIQLRGEKTMTNSNRHRWKLKSVNVNRIHIDASFQGANSLVADLVFYKNDAIYGNGFYGAASADFRGMGVVVDAVAQFGSSSGTNSDPYRYFLVDAKVDFGDGGIEMGGVRIKGFGGGLYRRMTRPSAEQAWSDLTGQGGPLDNNNLPDIGTTLSGIQYTPNENIFLGFEATVILAASGSDKSFNANLTLGMQFTDSLGGINLQRIWFQGNGKLMDAIDEAQVPSYSSEDGEDANGAMINAFVLIEYNFEEEILNANLQVNTNVADVMVGSSWAEIYVNKPANQWFFKIGEPSNRAEMTLQIPGIDVGITMGSYFMMGNYGIAAAPPPEFPAGFELGQGEEYESDRGEEYQTGAGLAFGTSIVIPEQSRKFLFLYAELAAGMGFDVAILDYGETSCANTNEIIGVNGWYARGQAWAYFLGSAGITAKVFGRTRNFTLADLAVAALIEAKGPNPFYARGAFEVHYNVLNGLLEGSEDFEIEFGEECDYVIDESYKTVTVIKKLGPENGSTNLGGDAVLTAEFLIPIDEPYEVSDLETGTTQEIKAVLEWSSLKRSGSTVHLQPIHESNWSDDKKKVTIKPKDILEPNSNYAFIQAISFEEKINGVWEPILDEDNGGVKYIEKDTTIFSTGEGSSVLYESLILRSNPINRQLNYYTKDGKQGYKNGYIQMGNRFQFDLVACYPEGYDFYARFSDMSGEIIYEPRAEFHLGNGLVFGIPSILEKEKIYQLDIVIKETSSTGWTGDGPATTAGGGTISGGGQNPGGGKPGTVGGKPNSGEPVPLGYPVVGQVVQAAADAGILGTVPLKDLAQQVLDVTETKDFDTALAMVVQQANSLKGYMISAESRSVVSGKAINGSDKEMEGIIAEVLAGTVLPNDAVLARPIVGEEIELKKAYIIYTAAIEVMNGATVTGSATEVDQYTNAVSTQTALQNSEELTQNIVIELIDDALMNNGGTIQAYTGDGGGGGYDSNNGPGTAIYPLPTIQDFCESDLPSAEEYGPERIIYTMHFRTSKYETFKEKMETYTASTGTYSDGDHVLTATLTGGDEGFDAFEFGQEEVKPLTYTADTDNNWYNNILSPLLYDDFPYELTIQTPFGNRKYNFPALTSVITSTFDKGSGATYQKLTEEEILADQFGGFSDYSATVRYDVGAIANIDFELYKSRALAAQNFVDQSGSNFNFPNHIQALIDVGDFPALTNGIYKIGFKVKESDHDPYLLSIAK